MYADFLEQIMLQKNQLDGENTIWEEYVNEILEKNIHVKKFIKMYLKLYSSDLKEKAGVE